MKTENAFIYQLISFEDEAFMVVSFERSMESFSTFVQTTIAITVWIIFTHQIDVCNFYESGPILWIIFMRFDCSTIKFIAALDYNFVHTVYHKQINENEHVPSQT